MEDIYYLFNYWLKTTTTTSNTCTTQIVCTQIKNKNMLIDLFHARNILLQ